MTTLRDILNLTWDVTRLDVDLREPSGALIRSYMIGTDLSYKWSSVCGQVEKGMLIIDEKSINHHLRGKKNGQPEMGWGTDFNAIPRELLDAEVTHFWQRSRGGGVNAGTWLKADVTPIQMRMEGL